jgi:hypothetical protein
MDPVTALALAGNILQFVDYGHKLLARAGELYRSTAGSLAVNDQIELVTTDLQTLISKLRLSFPSDDASDDKCEKRCEDGGGDDSGHDASSTFEEICDGAANVATELLEKLASLKVQPGKHRKWKTLKQAVRTLWSEERIETLLERLSRFKQALETRILFSLRLRISLLYLST